MTERPWCCPEPRCTPIHAVQGAEQPLDMPTPGESFMCFGRAPEVVFNYDGVEHANDLRTCMYSALKGVVSYQENADDWRIIGRGYKRALFLLEHQVGDLMTELQRKIAEIDFQLLTAGDRLKQYRTTGPGTSVIVQMGVCDRLLDARLLLMAERDRAVAR